MARKKKTRQKRKTNIDPKSLLKPFDATRLGSADDPCFGKLYKPENNICGMCGDATICSIALMQSERAKQELSTMMMDRDDFDFTFDPMMVERMIYVKLENGPLEVTTIMKFIFNKFKEVGATKETTKKVVIDVVKQSVKLKTIKEDGKRKVSRAKP